MNRLLLAAVSFLAASTAFLAAPAQAAVPAEPAAAVPKTTVTLLVSGCEGCTIAVTRAVNTTGVITPVKPAYWDGPHAIVRGGKAVLNVPTSITQGMSFTVMARWEQPGPGGSVTNIVLGSTSRPSGTRVSTTEAKKTKYATACWAGTTQARVTIRVSVIQDVYYGDGKRYLQSFAWASPTVPTVGEMTKTWHGRLGNQDAYYC